MTTVASNTARTILNESSPLHSVDSASDAHPQGTSSAGDREQPVNTLPSHRDDSSRWVLFNHNSKRPRSGSLPTDVVFREAHAAAAKRKTEQENAKKAAGTIMTVNSDAVLHNLNFAKKRLTELAEAAGRPVPERAMVLKANGYGIGAATLAGIGVKAGVRHFFVAHFSEAKELRQGLIDQGINPGSVNINVLHGPMPGTEKLFLEAGCTPVLNSLQQIKAWGKLAEKQGEKLSAILQFDSGMRRAGVSREEASQFLLSEEEVSFLKSRGAGLDLEGVKNLSEELLKEISDEDVTSMNESDGCSMPEKATAVLNAATIQTKYENREALLKNIDVKYVMSHLACAGDKQDKTNDEQLNAFTKIHEQFPGAGASLAASPGFYLGSKFHLDMVRLGSLVHGMESSDIPSPLEPAIKLETKILQIRDVKAGEGVGYGRTGASDRELRKIATLACGFGDGLPRGLNNIGKALIDGKEVPFTSKVMMDMVEVDVTDIHESLHKPGVLVQLLGPEYTIDDMAEDAKTIAADITTSLQDRVYREVVSGGLPFQQAQAEREELAALSRLPDLFVPDQHVQHA